MNSRRKASSLPILALAACALAGLAGPAWAVPEANTIEFSNCTLTMPGSTATAAARCGFLEVPENPREPSGRQIRLHVAVAEANSQAPEPDPLFFFAGGPGQAASESWVMIRNSLSKIRKERDIVLVDQRGTGRSNPLRCEGEDITELEAEIDLERIREETRDCLAGLDGDPRFYTTTIAAGDIDRVRRAMGYGEINIMGVSYGTRAAQVYERNFPGTVRTMTLDSVVPMDLALGQDHAPMLDRAVALVLEDCESESSCRAAFPNQEKELAALFARLREAPRNITITDPRTGQSEELLLTAETLAVAIRFLSYASETQALLPLLVHEAISTGRLERLASQAVLVLGDLTQMIARGMELSVMCAEDYPAIDFSADYSDTILGNAMLEGIEAQCGIWPRGEVPTDFRVPRSSPVPTLLLSGERDPVTPPEYAARAAESYPNHLNLVARGQSHSVLRNPCLQDIASEFVAAGDTDGLDTSCAENIRPAPFFTSLLGPEP